MTLLRRELKVALAVHGKNVERFTKAAINEGSLHSVLEEARKEAEGRGCSSCVSLSRFRHCFWYENAFCHEGPRGAPRSHRHPDAEGVPRKAVHSFHLIAEKADECM